MSVLPASATALTGQGTSCRGICRVEARLDLSVSIPPYPRRKGIRNTAISVLPGKANRTYVDRASDVILALPEEVLERNAPGATGLGQLLVCTSSGCFRWNIVPSLGKTIRSSPYQPAIRHARIKKSEMITNSGIHPAVRPQSGLAALGAPTWPESVHAVNGRGNPWWAD